MASIYDDKRHESIFDGTITKEELLNGPHPARKSAGAGSGAIETPIAAKVNIDRGLDKAINGMRNIIQNVFAMPRGQ